MMCYVNTSQIKGITLEMEPRTEKKRVVWLFKACQSFILIFGLKVQLSKSLCHVGVMGVVTGMNSNLLSVITCHLPFK